jgi:hypothetical protein
MISQQA